MTTEHKIGDGVPAARPHTMVFVGQLEHLQGKRALVAPNPPHGVVAQFDDRNTGLAFGWWAFRSWEFVSEADWENLFNRLVERSGYSVPAAKEKACAILRKPANREAPTPRYV